MKARTSIATILSFACTIASASNGSIGFTGRIVQPTVRPADAILATGRDASSPVASVRVGSLVTEDHPANPLLEYFVGYLRAGSAGASAALVEITYH
jgi:hypothetical protein